VSEALAKTGEVPMPDWEPEIKQRLVKLMLISTRFADTMQIHLEACRALLRPQRISVHLGDA
jgi:hypothetical protein